MIKKKLPNKLVIYSEEARKEIIKGVNTISDAVKVTLGPKGRNVIFEQVFGPPRITKDGVTVAKQVMTPKSIFSNMGVQLIKQVALKTNDEAGDGTTTATVLAQAIVLAGMKAVAADLNPMDLKRGINAGVKAVLAEIDQFSKPVEGDKQIAQVGTLAANGDWEIGQLISAAIKKVGHDGVITIEESGTMETELDLVEGMELENGMLSPYFSTDLEKMTCDLNNPYILVCDRRLNSLKTVVALLEAVIQMDGELFIIADDVVGEALQTLVVNRLKAGLKVCAVKSPGYGERRKEELLDIAAMTGATVITEDLGIEAENVDLEMLGKASRVNITMKNTVIIRGGGSPEGVKIRINQIKAQLDEATESYQREKIKDRLARMTGGVAVIRVGGATEVEVKEIKDRVDDALHATHAAVEEGIVPGGGVALYQAARRAAKKLNPGDLLPDQARGFSILIEACKAPVSRIVLNSGGNPGDVIARLNSSATVEFGYNARNGEYGDLMKMGIVDPTKVVKVALEGAASVAGLLITTEAMIAEELEPPIQIHGQNPIN